MNTSSLLMLVALGITAGCASPRAHLREAKVQILLNSESGDRGILVKVDAPVYASGDRMGEVRITVVNLLEEDVFLEVEGFDCLGYDLQVNDGDRQGWAGGGGAFTMFPDNTQHLKRLHGSSRGRDGRLFACGCCVEFIKGNLDTEDLDLKEWIGAKATVSIPISGYLRTNGQHFYEIVDVPMKIVDGQQTPAGDFLKDAPEE